MPVFSAMPFHPDRQTFARYIVIPAAVGCLWVGRTGGVPSPIDVACFAAGLALCLAPAASPWVVTGQSLILLAAEQFGDATPFAVKLLVALGLLELAAQRHRVRDVILGSAAVTVTYLLIGVPHWDSDAGDVLYKTFLAVSTPLLVGGFLYSTRQLLVESRERAAEAERSRTLTVQVARTAERTAISREVHDLVAHHVASIVLRVGVARHVVADADHQVREVLDDVHETSARAMADLRRLVSMLRQPDADVPADGWPMDPDELVPALHAVVSNSRQAGLTVDSRIDPAVRDVDPLQAITLLRITQEGLTNAGKHAGPGVCVRLDVRREAEGGTVVALDDDGARAPSPHDNTNRTGTAPQAAAPTKPDGVVTGHGIIGLRERAALLGGTLDAGPGATGRGWRLVATLPPPHPDNRPGALALAEHHDASRGDNGADGNAEGDRAADDGTVGETVR